MKRLIFTVLILAMVIPCYAGDVVDVNKLTDWIQLNKRPEGTVTPPPVVFTCPIDGLTFATQALLDAHKASAHPAPVGQFTAIIAGAKKCNTELDKIGGYGFYEGNTPGPTSVKSNGKTYFLLDPVWLPLKWKILGKRLTVMWINMRLTPGSQTSLYEIDSLDNGKLIGGPKGGTQDSFNFSYKIGVRWLVEVDTTACPSGYSLSIKWPY